MKLTMYNMELWFEPKEDRPGYVLLRARTLKDMRDYMFIVTLDEADQIAGAILIAADDAHKLAEKTKEQRARYSSGLPDSSIYKEIIESAFISHFGSTEAKNTD